MDLSKFKAEEKYPDFLICTKCNINKSLSNFQIRYKDNSPYLYRTCISCINEKQRISAAIRYKNNRESIGYKIDKRLNLLKENKGWCKCCNEIKDIINFKLKPKTKLGYSITCNKCISLRSKFANIKKHYNITKEEYETLLQKQHNKCGICNEDFKLKICVDHDHANGAIRGLLCDKCNRGMGLLQDDSNILLKAVSYLEASPFKIPLNGETPNEDNPVLN